VIKAVLFDRDGTLIADLPDRRERIMPMPGATKALERVRECGLHVGVVTNQPGVDPNDLRRVHRRIEDALGPIDGWFVCMHDAAEACACRKPRPGLIFQAAKTYGITPQECALVGDIGSDIDAAHAAGAQAVLVPTPVTLQHEIERAPLVCNDLLQAVDVIIGARTLS
jgi:D-glycero-D-manno-heptose 1,7-bisphosphate phosphatase